MSKKFKLSLILPLLLILIFSYPLKLSFVVGLPLAGTGPGYCTVTPNIVYSGETGKDFTFTYIATKRMTGGLVTIKVHDDFTPPQIFSSSGEVYICGGFGDVIFGETYDNLDDYTSWYSSDYTKFARTKDTTTKMEGEASLKITVDKTAPAGSYVYANKVLNSWGSGTFSTSFWIRSSINSPDGAIQFAYSYNQNLTSYSTIPLPALAANTWTYIVLNINEPTYPDLIKSIGFIYFNNYMATKGGNIYIDEILEENVNLKVVGKEIKVRILDMNPDDSFQICYNNVNIPTYTQDKDCTFETKSRENPSKNLDTIPSSPIIKVLKKPSATKLIFLPSYKPSIYDGLLAGNWTSGPIKVQRRDASNNPITSSDLKVDLSTTSPFGKGKFALSYGGSPITSITIPDGSSTAEFYYYDETAGTWTITASAKDLTSAVDNITVNPGSVSQLVITLPGETFESGKGNTGTPTAQTAGTGFQIKLRYIDQYFNLITSVSGIASLIFSGPGNAPDGTKPTYNGKKYSEMPININFTNGVSDPVTVILYRAETVQIHIVDSSSYSGVSSLLTINPSAFDKFDKLKFLDDELLTTRVAGQSFPVLITPLDQYENPTKITGTVYLALVDSSNHPIPPPPSPIIYPSTVTFNNESSKRVDVTIYKSCLYVTIEAQNQDGTKKGYSDFIDIQHGDLDHFRFDNIGPYVQQGVPFLITIYAEDEWGNLIDNKAGATAYQGTVNLTCSLGDDKMTPVTRSFTAGDDSNHNDGKTTFNITIIAPGTSVTITTVDTTLNKSGTSNSFPVFGAIHHYDFDTIGSQVKEHPFSVKIYAKDMAGNTLLNNTNPINLLAEANDGTTVTIQPPSVTPANGVWSGNVTINTVNPQVRIKAIRSGHTEFGVSNWFTVADNAPTKFIFDTISSPKIAGTPFSITIRAVDYYNSPVTNYNGSATLSASTGAGTISPTSITFTNGVYTGNVTLTTPNPSVVLTCYDSTTSAMGTSNAFQVTGGVESFRFSTISSPQYKNENIYISIQAVDINGDIVTGFNGTVTLSSTAGTITPTSANFVGGMWSGNVKINGEGQNIRVQATYSSKTGFSDPFTILPFSQLVFEPIISSPQYVDVTFSITVKAKTPSGAPGTWSGTLSLSCSLGNDKIDKNSLTMTNGTVTDNVKISQRATGVTLTVQTTIYGSTISGTSNVFEVKEGNKLAFITSEQIIPIETASGDIKVQIQDQDGNPVTASANVTVNLTSSSTTGRFSTDKNTWSTSSSHSVTIPSGQNQVTFYYKDTSPGLHTLTAKATGLRDGTQTIRVSVDGSGECKISPDSAFVRETNKDFTLTFTSKATMDGGEIQITIPSAFSSPQKTSPAGEGYISITAGSGVTIGDWTISGYTINIPINIMPKDRT
ncbi:MAG TPA: hypothetical protein PLI22_04610, partial [Caldisericia bacterium]|nr:hypothetical protein [Caldisericia bacterium]